ncbi:hypothetical protein DXG01_002468 [Tephrocybe rancida]|nr:hypothetical protein DXG01_002468 [Tephrocybe rancida]
MAQTLPSKVKYRIANHCSPKTLFSLALVQRAFQPEAERELYATIAVTARTFTSVFETLSSNSKKAELVRFLTLEALVSFLPTLTSLTDLRVRFYLEKEMACGQELSDIIRGCHFRLHTLFCNEWLDLVQIVKKQSDLKFLGIHGGFGRGILPILKQLQSESVPIPITSYLYYESTVTDYNCIQLFPAFPPPRTDQRPYRALKPIIDRDCGSLMTMERNKIIQAEVFYVDVGDTVHVADVILDMADCFPNVYALTLLAQQPSKVDLAEIKQIISPIRDLEELEFRKWYDETKEATRSDERHDIHPDKKLACAQEWEGKFLEICLSQGQSHSPKRPGKLIALTQDLNDLTLARFSTTAWTGASSVASLGAAKSICW